MAMVQRLNPDGLAGATAHHHEIAKMRSAGLRGASGGSTTMTPWSCMSSTSRRPTRIDPALCAVVVRPRRRRLELERRSCAFTGTMTRVRLPARLAEAVDDERLVEPVADGRADLGAHRDANERARVSRAPCPTSANAATSSARPLSPSGRQHAGSRLERDGQDPVLERSGGPAVVVRGRCGRRLGGAAGPAASEPRDASRAYAIHFGMSRPREDMSPRPSSALERAAVARGGSRRGRRIGQRDWAGDGSNLHAGGQRRQLEGVPGRGRGRGIAFRQARAHADRRRDPGIRGPTDQ